MHFRGPERDGDSVTRFAHLEGDGTAPELRHSTCGVRKGDCRVGMSAGPFRRSDGVRQRPPCPDCSPARQTNADLLLLAGRRGLDNRRCRSRQPHSSLLPPGRSRCSGHTGLSCRRPLTLALFPGSGVLPLSHVPQFPPVEHPAVHPGGVGGSSTSSPPSGRASPLRCASGSLTT